MNLDYLPLLLLLLGLLFSAIGLGLEAILIRRARRSRPRRLSMICMDCGAHIGGAHPSTTNMISHGICPPCGRRWRSQILSAPDRTWQSVRNARKN